MLHNYTNYFVSNVYKVSKMHFSSTISVVKKHTYVAQLT
jgi:hypothetical protein